MIDDGRRNFPQCLPNRRMIGQVEPVDRRAGRQAVKRGARPDERVDTGTLRHVPCGERAADEARRAGNGDPLDHLALRHEHRLGQRHQEPAATCREA